MEEKLYIDFENALMSSSLYLEEVLKSLNTGCLRRFGKNVVALMCKTYQLTGSLKSLPYDSRTLSIIHNNYENAQIILVGHKDVEIYLQRAATELLNSGLQVVECKTYVNQTEKETIVNSHYICGSIFDIYLIRKVQAVSFVLPMLFATVFGLLSKRHVDNRSRELYGFFPIFWRYIKIIWPITAIWPAMFETQKTDLNFMMGCFLTSLTWMSFMGLLRTFKELDTEREFSRQEYEIFCGKDFIYYGYSLKIAAGFAIMYLILSLLLFLKYPLSSLIGLSMGISYFIFYLAKRRSLYLLIQIILLHLIFSPKFTLLFFTTIFFGN